MDKLEVKLIKSYLVFAGASVSCVIALIVIYAVIAAFVEHYAN